MFLRYESKISHSKRSNNEISLLKIDVKQKNLVRAKVTGRAHEVRNEHHPLSFEIPKISPDFRVQLSRVGTVTRL